MRRLNVHEQHRSESKRGKKMMIMMMEGTFKNERGECEVKKVLKNPGRLP